MQGNRIWNFLDSLTESASTKCHLGVAKMRSWWPVEPPRSPRRQGPGGPTRYQPLPIPAFLGALASWRFTPGPRRKPQDDANSKCDCPGHSTDAAEAERMVHAALDAGVTFFDTADGYNNGESEVMLGRALGARRRESVVATKVFNAMGPGPNDSGMSRVHIMHAVDDSLRRLGTDYIDLYYIHHVDVQTPLEEMLRAFDDLVHQGKIRYTACSNYEAWRLMEALWISDSKGLARFAAYQPQYSLVVRDIEEELVPACGLKGLGMVVWSPLAGGYLSGKYQPGEQHVAGSRSAENWSFPVRFFHPLHEAILAELLAVARDMNRGPAEVAVRWVLQQSMVTS